MCVFRIGRPPKYRKNQQRDYQSEFKSIIIIILICASCIHILETFEKSPCCLCVCFQPCLQRERIRHCSCRLWTVSQTGPCLCAGSNTVSCCPGSRASTPTRWRRGAWTRWGHILVSLILGWFAETEARCFCVAGLQVCPQSDWLWRAGPCFQRRGGWNTDSAPICSGHCYFPTGATAVQHSISLAAPIVFTKSKTNLLN